MESPKLFLALLVLPLVSDSVIGEKPLLKRVTNLFNLFKGSKSSDDTLSPEEQKEVLWGGQVDNDLLKSKKWDLFPHELCGFGTSSDEFPWIVKYYKNFKVDNTSDETDESLKKPICAGTIVNRNYILTAASCCKGNKYWKFMPVIGIGANEKRITAKKLIIHDKFDKGRNDSDICLVRLETPMTFTASAQPICLPVYKRFKDEWVNATFMEAGGWGKDDSDGDSSEVLQLKTYIRRMYETMKNSSLGEPKLISQDHKASRGVDIGGPLVKLDKKSERHFLFGITSQISKFIRDSEVAEGLSDDLYQTYFTNVYDHLKWIIQNTEP